MTNTKYYPEVNSNADFAAIEKEILKFWQDNNIFQKSIDDRNGESEFIFMTDHLLPTVYRITVTCLPVLLKTYMLDIKP